MLTALQCVSAPVCNTSMESMFLLCLIFVFTLQKPTMTMSQSKHVCLGLNVRVEYYKRDSTSLFRSASTLPADSPLETTFSSGLRHGARAQNGCVYIVRWTGLWGVQLRARGPRLNFSKHRFCVSWNKAEKHLFLHLWSEGPRWPSLFTAYLHIRCETNSTWCCYVRLRGVPRQDASGGIITQERKGSSVKLPPHDEAPTVSHVCISQPVALPRWSWPYGSPWHGVMLSPRVAAKL